MMDETLTELLNYQQMTIQAQAQTIQVLNNVILGLRASQSNYAQLPEDSVGNYVMPDQEEFDDHVPINMSVESYEDREFTELDS
jgi:hypothetical protein